MRICSLVVTEENSKITWSVLCSVLLTPNLKGVNFSKSSQVGQIMVYDTNYLRKNGQNMLLLFQKDMQT